MGRELIRHWPPRGEMTMLIFYFDALKMIDPGISWIDRSPASERRVREAEEQYLRMVSERAGTFHPDAPIYWPPLPQVDLPPTYRMVYERLTPRGKRYGDLGWMCKGIPITPARLRRDLEAAGFNMNPHEVNLPYIGGWPGCKEWKERVQHVWNTRAHVCTRCGRAIARGKGEGQVHHLDGHSWNNHDENVALRCRDCNVLRSFRQKERTKKSANGASR